MEKTRVPKGEEYGYVDECGYLTTDYDEGRPLDDIRYEVGNYFNLKDDVDYQRAESMARKLRAVLKGANVIEMPSGEDFMKAEKERFRKSGFSDSFDPYDIFYGGFVDCYDFLKSKIVK